MKKRILAILLAAIMLMGTLSLSFVQAADLQYDTDGDGESFALEVTDATIQKTDTEVTVDVNFAENTGVWAFKFYLVYDKALSIAANSSVVEGDIFEDFNPNTDVGVKNATHEEMLSDVDYADSLANAGIEGNSDIRVAAVYSECADVASWCTDIGKLCSVTFKIDPELAKDEYTVYAVPTTGGWCLREDWESPNADDAGYVEIYDPACIPGTITVESNDPKITVSDAEIVVGAATADFTLTLENNPGIWGITGYINYDEAMSLEAFTNGEIFADADLALGGPMVAGNEAMKDINVADNKVARDVYNAIGASYDGVLATKVYFEPTTFVATTADGVIVSFSLNTSALEVGTYEIAFYFDEYGIIDADGIGLEVEAVYGTLTVIDCAHEWDAGVTVDPTCTVPGTITKTCTLCGGTDVTEIPALEHAYDEGVVTTPAECGVAGVKTYTCTRDCGEEGWQYTEEVPALDHNYVAGTPVAPTCTEQGYTTYTCDLCGNHYDADYVDALGHEFDEGVVTTEPTCVDEGVKTFTCTRNCGEEGNTYTEPVAALGHDEYITGSSGSCGEVGVTHYGCTRCDYTHDVEGEVIPHAYEEVGYTAPTCTVAGERRYACSKECGKADATYAEPVAALGHSYDEGVVTTDPTCTVAGEKTFTCTRNCGEADAVYTEPVAALGHEYDSVETPATCTKDGFITKTCTRNCGEADDVVVEPGEEALGHWYDDGVVTTDPTCTVAGEKTYTCQEFCGEEGDVYTEPVAALGHDYNSVVTPATCTEAGYTTKTCTRNCGEADDVVVVPGEAALGHDYNLVNAKEATCTENGYTGDQVCSRCDNTIMGEVIPALGHNWDEGVVTAPECEKDGYTTYTCQRCDTTDVRDIVPGLEHVEDELVVDPECEKEGYTVTICTVCQKELTERTDIKPALEHVYADVVTAPTCEEKGFTTYTCTLCDDTYTDDFVDALGHKWDNGVVTTPATEEAEGVKTFTCEVCQETKTEAVAKLEAAEKEEDKKEKDKKEEDKKEENKTEETKKPTSAQTGDAVVAFVLIALVAVVSLAAVVISKKKIFSGR